MNAKLGGAVLIVAAIGCKGEGRPQSSTNQGPGTTATSSPAAPAAAAASTPAAAPAVRLSVARSAEHGPYLTDANGRALYLLESDGGASGGCYERCLAIWQALFAGQTTTLTAADSAVRARLIGTVRRRDGLLQVTYNGHPLYYYVADGGPGQTLGQHVEDAWGEWYLVSPAGREVASPRRRREGDDRRGRGRR